MCSPSLTLTRLDCLSISLTGEKEISCLFYSLLGSYPTCSSIFQMLCTHKLNSLFQDNMATNGSADSTALTAYRVLLTFNGNSWFASNFGGGISLLGSRMDVRGQVHLDRNTAVFGAGIAMTGRSLVSKGVDRHMTQVLSKWLRLYIFPFTASSFLNFSPIIKKSMVVMFHFSLYAYPLLSFLNQLLLFEGALLDFTNNVALDEGAGLYVEYTSSDFVLAVLNRGCFIQYFSQLVDVPPSEWVS